jgi:holo-[acyl-carrier protein] synthase
MITGIGVDIVEISKIEKSIESDAFQRRVFTASEIDTCERFTKKAQFLAGKFAAKEAFMKAIRSGIRQEVWFTQIEVLNRETGEPYIHVSGKARQRLDELNASHVHVSISHDGKLAVALVILEV